MEEVKIERYLLNKGIPPQLKGFRYIVKAIELCLRDMKYLYNITTKLYPNISQIYDDTPARTERAIRHAIKFLDREYKNSEFLATALIELKENYGKNKMEGYTKCLTTGKSKGKQ